MYNQYHAALPSGDPPSPAEISISHPRQHRLPIQTKQAHPHDVKPPSLAQPTVQSDHRHSKHHPSNPSFLLTLPLASKKPNHRRFAINSPTRGTTPTPHPTPTKRPASDPPLQKGRQGPARPCPQPSRFCNPPMQATLIPIPRGRPRPTLPYLGTLPSCTLLQTASCRKAEPLPSHLSGRVG